MQQYADRPWRRGTPATRIFMDENRVRVETRGLILEHNFNVSKTLLCDRSSAVSATGPTQ